MKIYTNKKAVLLSLAGLFTAQSFAACSRERSISVPEAERRQFSSDEDRVESSYKSVTAQEVLEAGLQSTDGQVTPDQQRPDLGDAIADAQTEADANLPDPVIPVLPTPVVTPSAPDPVLSPSPAPLPAPSTMPVITKGRYLLQSVQSHRCMDVPAGKSDNEWQLQIYDCSETNSNQIMQIEFVEQNYYKILTSNKKNLEVKKDNLKAGAAFIQNAPTGASNQQFSFEGTSTPSVYIIKLRGQNLVVDVAGGQTANNSYLQVAPNKSQDNQKWLLITLP